MTDRSLGVNIYSVITVCLIVGWELILPSLSDSPVYLLNTSLECVHICICVVFAVPWFAIFKVWWMQNAKEARWRSYNQKYHKVWSVVSLTTSGKPEGEVGCRLRAEEIHLILEQLWIVLSLTTCGCIYVWQRFCLKSCGLCSIWKVGSHWEVVAPSCGE